jgi:HK97 family phage major capsid protein
MSPNIQALADELDALRTELVELEAIETPTEEQVARSAAILTEWDDKKASHDALVERAARIDAIRSAQVAGRVEPAFSAPQVMKRTDPFADLDGLRFANPNSEDVIARAVTAVTDHRFRGVTDEHVESAVRTIESVPGAAAHALVYGSPAYLSAFRTWGNAAGRGQSPAFSPEEAAAMRTALSLTTGSGGYTLPTLLDPSIILTSNQVKNGIREIARVDTITQNVWYGVSSAGVTSYWTAEAAAVTDGSPTFVQPSVTASKVTSYALGSYEIFEDSRLLSQLPELIAESLSDIEQEAFVSGSGSGAPKGIVTAISATAGSTVTATTRGSYSSVDLFAVVDAIPTRHEDKSTWLANKKTYSGIRQWSTASTGALFWSDLGHALPNVLLESPYVKASSMATTTVSGTVLLILGDFKKFLVVDRIGTQVEFMQNVVNTNGLPTGQRALVAHKRVGSDVLDTNAFRFLKT